jgi:hypothetical protein
MTFADYKHFNGNNNMISIGNMLTTHRLVGFYDNYIWGASKKFIDPFLYSTNGAYIDIMTMVGMRKFLVSRLNIARKLALREVLPTTCTLPIRIFIMLNLVMVLTALLVFSDWNLAIDSKMVHLPKTPQLRELPRLFVFLSTQEYVEV